jgi:hypothetical protein
MESVVHELRNKEGEKVGFTRDLLALLHQAAAGPVLAEPESGPDTAHDDPAKTFDARLPELPDDLQTDVEPLPDTTVEDPAALEAIEPIERPEVISRAEAEEMYQDPLSVLGGGSDLPSVARELVEHWVEPQNKKAAQRDRLRRLFYEYLGSFMTLPSVEGKVIRIESASLASVAESHGDASLAERARAFESLVIMSAPMSDGLTTVAFAQNLLAFAASDGDSREARLFLAPHLNKEWRDEAIRRLRAASAPIALIDDVDLCRLLSPGQVPPHAMVAMLRIVLEQMEAVANA